MKDCQESVEIKLAKDMMKASSLPPFGDAAGAPALLPWGPGLFYV